MNKKLNKKPRFFCDNCGNEVGNEVKNCPYCGRFFASVRCPSCGHSGPDEIFQNGCPMCGYSTPPYSAPATKPPKTSKTKPSKNKEYRSAEPLPFWTYFIILAALFAVIALLSYFITR